ncbi:peptide ABC transporter permease [Sphaerotilus microaerophilus]|uniref:Peptide ABC transporter permease n=2 Tax=Sphaerotilus microaerophilus TaxID=2914710 RepID=A0ABN6PLP9_9BURK|nr:peptide ABC transporter permease [Sphaerotilus sp. FB-5]
MMPKFVVLWTDAVLWGAWAATLAYAWHVRRQPHLSASWRKVWRDGAAMSATVVLAFFMVVTLLDSVHFRRALPPTAGQAAGQVFHATRTESVLDVLLAGQANQQEATYSRPLSYQGFTRVSEEVGGEVRRVHPRLQYGGAHLQDPERQWLGDLAWRGGLGLAAGALAGGLLLLAGLPLARRQDAALSGVPTALALRRLLADRCELPWRAGWITALLLCLLAGLAVGLGSGYHVLGTDNLGNDVFYQALKSVRTAFVIGTMASVATLPFAIALGILAGWYRGWVDEVIQYLYTVLSSVPNVLLIAACVLMVQVFLDKHPELFETGAERADLKIFMLCLILGLTGWAGLCRLLRGETLKLRELDYVQAATAFGVGSLRIMHRHILPNVVHLVLINTVLDFSALILYEAVLSYVGVGVDPSMNSFGGMINMGRDEMSRDPLVWWSFSAAFVFMVALVLAANLFADGVRDAFDPRARNLRPRLGLGRAGQRRAGVTGESA